MHARRRRATAIVQSSKLALRYLDICRGDAGVIAGSTAMYSALRVRRKRNGFRGPMIARGNQGKGRAAPLKKRQLVLGIGT